MRRHHLLLIPTLLIAAAMAGGCRFNKATDKEIAPPPDPGEEMDSGVIDRPGIDVIVVPPPDAQLFESEANVNCIEANPMTMSLPPDVLIVLDRSGSMNDKIDGTACNNTCRTGGMSKWLQMTTTLNGFIPNLTSVNWGLKLFASDSANGSCTVSPTIEVPPAAATAGAIATATGTGVMAGSATPTAAAEAAAMNYLMGLNDGNPKFILLATDGIPTCGQAQCAPGVVTTGSQTQCDDMNAIAAVQTAHDMGISTFVIGIGTSIGGGDATLTAMAQAGGYPQTGAQAYFSVDSPQALQDAFAMITKTVNTCFFGVSPAPKSMKDITDVKGDGNIIPQDATDGWTFVSAPNAGVQLNGKSCDDYKSGALKTVFVDLPCIVF